MMKKKSLKKHVFLKTMVPWVLILIIGAAIKLVMIIIEAISGTLTFKSIEGFLLIVVAILIVDLLAMHANYQDEDDKKEEDYGKN